MTLLLLIASATVGIGFICYGTRTWLQGKERTHSPQTPAEVTTLKELSHLWTDTEIKIKDAACLWREQVRQNRALPRPQFKHEELNRFFAEMIAERPSVSGVRRTLIIKLLTLLDEEGDCPSVVRAHALEAERMYPDDSYALLATVHLYRHTVTVARNFIAKADQEALLADMIIIALAHDIGKIPSYHDGMYQSGDHPVIAGFVLNSQKGNKAGATPETCQLALLGEGMQHIQTLEEKTLLLLNAAQQSYATAAAEINAVEMIVQNMKKFDDTVFSELADRFGKGIAMRATGRI